MACTCCFCKHVEELVHTVDCESDVIGHQNLLAYLAEKNIDYQKQEWYQRSEIEEVDANQLRDDDLFLALYQTILNKSRAEDNHLLELMTRYKKQNSHFTTRENYSSLLAEKKALPIASLNMPVQVFLAAVKLAISDVVTDGRYEKSNAVQALCAWWNEHAPNKETKCAGYFKLWVKHDDVDGCFLNADLESPSTHSEGLALCAAGNAGMGECVILEFMKGCQHFTARGTNKDFIQTYNVTGATNDSIDATLEEAQNGQRDEAWQTYKALTSFPLAFPDAWSSLLDSVSRSDNRKVL